jgi:hypothetical protein
MAVFLSVCCRGQTRVAIEARIVALPVSTKSEEDPHRCLAGCLPLVELTDDFQFPSIHFLVVIYVAFFASGAACLMAEVTWNRMLIVVVGNSVTATAMIIVVFMGGLGLGSQVGGRIS